MCIRDRYRPILYRWSAVDVAAARFDDVLKHELTAVAQFEHFEVQRHRGPVASYVHRLHDLFHFQRVVRHTATHASIRIAPHHGYS